jgi:3-oxoacyl-[acyl-carrier protein] reductase
MAQTRSAIVTGGVSGLGRAVAQRLLDVGYAVTVTHRSSRAKADAFLELARSRGQPLLALAADAADEGDVAAMVRAHREHYGVPWALVHAAGPFLLSRTPLSEVDLPKLRAVLDGNLWSAMLCAKAALELMHEGAGGGRIVFFGYDEAAFLPAWSGRAAYAAAKSGVVSLARSLSAEEAPHGITVNVICPGDIRRPFKEGSIAEARRSTDDAAPVGRPGSGEDVARLTDFLLDQDSDFLTGNIIAVDGGLDVIHRGRG